ncbi:MAG: glycosyltransferase family 2 protein [Nitrososphaera sp.]
MASPTRYALVPTRNRPKHLHDLVSSLHKQGCDTIVIIDNGSDPPVDVDALGALGPALVSVTVVPLQPPHLYRMWNVGLDLIGSLQDAHDRGAYDVAVLNDDAQLPVGWFDYVASNLRQAPVQPMPVIACSDPYGHLNAPLFKREPDGNLSTRMCPWAFVMRGETNLRADERFHWWWGDTDLDWQACQAGGVLLLPGYTTQNTLANSTTHGELAHQAGLDGQMFSAKWGRRPW